MHRKLFAPVAALMGFLLITAAAPSRADYNMGNVYSAGGAVCLDGSFLSVYVSASKFSGSARGSISLSGTSGRLTCAVTKLTFADDKRSAIAEGNLVFNGIPARATVSVSNTGRGIISWSVTDANGGVLWSSGSPLNMVSGSTLIYNVF